MGLMGLKFENKKKRSVKINVLYAPNKSALPEKLSMDFLLRRGLFVLWESALGTPALFIFSIIAIFIRIPSRSLCRGGRSMD